MRGADVGLLYHPGRRGEAEVWARWKESLAASAPSDYVGIELEVNQGMVLAAGRRCGAS